MPATYEPIATTTLSSNTNSISFSSIPNTYSDLRLIVVARSARVTTGDDIYYVRLNGDSGANYSAVWVQANATTASAGQITNTTAVGWFQRLPGASNPTGMFSYCSFDIMNYTGSSFKTTLVTQNQNTNGSGGFSGPAVRLTSSTWRNTSAVTSIGIGFSSFDLAAGTTATLYGIKRA